MKTVSECQRSCDAKAKCEATCTAPSVSVAIESNLPAEKVKAAKLVDAFKAGLPELLQVKKRVEGAIEGSVDAYVNTLKSLPETIKSAGPMGAGCVGAVVVSSASAVVKIKGSIAGVVAVSTAALARAN